MLRTFSRALIARFNAEREQIKEKLARGPPQSPDNYARLVGEAEQLRACAEMVRVELKKHDEDAD